MCVHKTDVKCVLIVCHFFFFFEVQALVVSSLTAAVVWSKIYVGSMYNFKFFVDYVKGHRTISRGDI